MGAKQKIEQCVQCERFEEKCAKKLTLLAEGHQLVTGADFVDNQQIQTADQANLFSSIT
jgi:hypothetical protein